MRRQPDLEQETDVERVDQTGCSILVFGFHDTAVYTRTKQASVSHFWSFLSVKWVTKLSTMEPHLELSCPVLLSGNRA